MARTINAATRSLLAENVASTIEAQAEGTLRRACDCWTFVICADADLSTVSGHVADLLSVDLDAVGTRAPDRAANVAAWLPAYDDLTDALTHRWVKLPVDSWLHLALTGVPDATATQGTRIPAALDVDAMLAANGVCRSVDQGS